MTGKKSSKAKSKSAGRLNKSPIVKKAKAAAIRRTKVSEFESQSGVSLYLINQLMRNETGFSYGEWQIYGRHLENSESISHAEDKIWHEEIDDAYHRISYSDSVKSIGVSESLFKRIRDEHTELAYADMHKWARFVSIRKLHKESIDDLIREAKENFAVQGVEKSKKGITIERAISGLGFDGHQFQEAVKEITDFTYGQWKEFKDYLEGSASIDAAQEKIWNDIVELAYSKNVKSARRAAKSLNLSIRTFNVALKKYFPRGEFSELLAYSSFI